MQIIIDESEILKFTNFHLKHNTDKVSEQDIRNYFGDVEQITIDEAQRDLEQSLMMAEIDEPKMMIETPEWFSYDEALLLPWQQDYINRVKRNN